MHAMYIVRKLNMSTCRLSLLFFIHATVVDTSVAHASFALKQIRYTNIETPSVHRSRLQWAIHVQSSGVSALAR